MVAIKINETYYVAYKQNEAGNPHPKKYPCLFDTRHERIAENQRALLKNFFITNNLNYHDVISYQESNINTHDLVTAVIKFHDLRRI